MVEWTSRSEKNYRRLVEFLDNDRPEMKMTLYKKEFTKLERLIYQRDLPVQIEMKELSPSQVEVILRK